ncbi:Protein PTHB1, partial [Tetrabaena socialis]
MSLFKAREWWHTQCGHGEEFDMGCLLVANIDNDPTGQGCDYVSVQSYDGQLYFFEAERLAFTRYLPSFLVPGPLAYLEVCDTFVTCTAALELEAYKYKVIAAASSEKARRIWGNLGDWVWNLDLRPSGSGAWIRGSKDLSSPTGAGPAAGGGNKKMQADWRVVLGEAAIDIRVGRFSQ